MTYVSQSPPLSSLSLSSLTPLVPRLQLQLSSHPLTKHKLHKYTFHIHSLRERELKSKEINFTKVCTNVARVELSMSMRHTRRMCNVWVMDKV